MTSGARITLPPQAAPMHWWPRQTPRTGMRPAAQRMIEVDMPASSGRPGPGLMRTASGARAAMTAPLAAV